MHRVRLELGTALGVLHNYRPCAGIINAAQHVTLVGSLAPRLLRAALLEVDGWNWDGFHYDVDDFRADWDKVRRVAEEVGRDPQTLSVSAHLVIRTDGAEGLPIDPIPYRIIEGGAAAIAAGLRDFVDAGVDEFTLILDPARPRAIETLARAAEEAAS